MVTAIYSVHHENLDISQDQAFEQQGQTLFAANNETFKLDSNVVITPNAQQPICTVDFSTPDIQTVGAQLEPVGRISYLNQGRWVDGGPTTHYNSYFGNSWVLDWQGESFIRVRTTIEHSDTQKKYLLYLVHCSATGGGSPITILVNGYVKTSGHNPNSVNNYTRQRFDISEYLIDGVNTIEIRLDRNRNATSTYWIQSLAIIES